jgi:Putative auto-transporter adhesin, head GIN domain
MKKILITYFAFFLALSISFAQTKETRNVETFTKIAFRVPGKLYLKQGPEQKVELEGSKEILSKIETEVSGGRLSIGRESENWKMWNWDNDDKIVVYVTVKDLEGVSVSGSGDLIGESKFKTGDLDLNVSGSGSLQLEADASGELGADVSGSGRIDFKGNCKDLESKVSGSGKVSVALSSANKVEVGVSGSGKVMASGNAKEIKTNISGSGEVLAADLQVERCEVRISGSGDVEVNVKSELDATISGSGSVSYKGNPGHVNSHASGSGKVRKM